MIDKETAIELAKEAHGPITSQWMDMDYAALHRLCNLAAKHAQKDAEPVAAFILSKADNKTPFTFAATKQALLEYESEGFATQRLFTHPAHDDTALLRQARDALKTSWNPKIGSVAREDSAKAAITAINERLGEKV